MGTGTHRHLLFQRCQQPPQSHVRRLGDRGIGGGNEPEGWEVRSMKSRLMQSAKAARRAAVAAAFVSCALVAATPLGAQAAGPAWHFEVLDGAGSPFPG